MQVFMEIILFIASIVIIVAVLMQESKSDGVASLTAETNISGKGGKKSKDAVLSQVTIVASVVFFIVAIAMAAIK